MKCSKCGAELENNAAACPLCGQAVSDGERAARGQNSGQQLTKKEFAQLPAMKNCKGIIYACGIVLYVCGGINIGLQLYGGLLPLDGIIILLLGLGIHLGKSRICAVLCAAYSIFNTIYLAVTTGLFSGWLILVMAAFAVIYTFKYQSAWSRYQKEGILPEEKK